MIFFPSFSPAAEKTGVTDIRYWSYSGYTRVVIDLSDEAVFTNNRLSSPDRLYLDIKNSSIRKELQKNISVGNGMLKSVRSGQHDKNTVRVVLDLEKITDFKVFTLAKPSRIIVDIFGPKTFSVKKTIVIDPGHGGKDPGAIGHGRLYEKDIVLDVALKLKKILSNDPNIEVFLTREKDVFIPLPERTAIANGRNADLFVSIHANASRRKKLKGIETYFLNWTDNEEAQKVAARENAISLKQMKRLKKKMDIKDIILSDLSREYKRNESMALANYVQKSMVNGLDRNYKNVVDLGVKWSYFYVLFGADMPSTLLEISFVSNPLEGRRLAKDKYRADLANSIATGIKKYMSSMPEGQMIASTVKTIGP